MGKKISPEQLLDGVRQQLLYSGSADSAAHVQGGSFLVTLKNGQSFRLMAVEVEKKEPAENSRAICENGAAIFYQGGKWFHLQTGLECGDPGQ